MDGTIFDFHLKGVRVDVGGDCLPGDTSCTPVPEGVGALAKLLQNLEAQEFQRGRCRTQLPPP